MTVEPGEFCNAELNSVIGAHKLAEPTKAVNG
jgi:hypothetical protein